VTHPKLRRTLVLSVVLVLTLALASIAFASAKQNSFDATSGTSVLSPDVEMFEALSDYGVTAAPVEGAKANNKGLVFKITGGVVKAPGPTGTIEHSGGIEFTNANTGDSVTFDDFLVKLGKKKAKLFATTGTDALRFLNLDLSNATVSGSQGADLKIKNLDATLARPATKVLSEVVGAEINKNAPIGVLKVKAQTAAQ
jgi:Htaa